MSLNSRIKDAKKWYIEAKNRYFGARKNLRVVRDQIKKATKELRDVQDRIPHAQGGVLDDLRAKEAKLKDKLKELNKSQEKLAYQVKHRKEIAQHLKKKYKALVKKKEDKEPDVPSGGSGYATFDGKTVAAWMVPWLVKSRANGWHGVVVSGVRTAAYSQQLCYNMCGHPTCPGTCAGIYSNHNMEPNEGYPEGALDVSDYYTFERVQWAIGSPLKNDLPADPVHFSVSGH